jgi:hypothetical protein
MTSILKTPKDPIRVMRPDPRQPVIDALEKLLAARERAWRVTRQLQWDWLPGGRPMPSGGRGYADAQQVLDEHNNARHALDRAVTCYLDAKAPKPAFVPAPVVAVATPPSIVVAPTKSLIEAAAKPRGKPLVGRVSERPAPGAFLWSEPNTRWLTGLTRPSKSPSDTWESRFLFPRPDSVISKHWVAAMNGHVFVMLAVAEDIVWPLASGIPRAPIQLTTDQLAPMRRMIDGMGFAPGSTVTVGFLRKWAPAAFVKGEDPEVSVMPGTIRGLHVNRRLVAAAVAFLRPDETVAVFPGVNERCVRLDGAGFQAFVMGRLADKSEDPGPELLT